MDENSLKVLLARGVSVEEIGRRFDRDPSTVSYWMRKYGLGAPNAEKHAAKGGIPREQLEPMVTDGMTIAEIAEAVGLSKGTVRHWLGKHRLKTVNQAGQRPRAEVAAAKADGLVDARLSCPKHGATNYVIDTSGRYRCRRCRSEAVTRRRRTVKAILVAEAGGGCAICGYERCQAALAFHHLDPAQKRMMVSAQGMGIGIEHLRAEADKCVLLCHNCHAEVESGASVVPIQLLESPQGVDRKDRSPG